MYRAGTMDENINSQNNKQIDRATKSDINHPAPTPRSSYVASFPYVQIRGRYVAQAEQVPHYQLKWNGESTYKEQTKKLADDVAMFQARGLIITEPKSV